MDKQSKRVRAKVAAGKDSFALIGILAYIGSLIFRIVLYYFIGEKGVGYFGIANEIFVVFSFFFSYGLSEAVAVLIRYRIKRDQYKNAQRVLHGAFILAVILGGIFSVMFLLGGQFFADKIIGVPLAGIAISMMAPAMVFNLLTGVLRGYFQGNGSKVPSIHSKLLEVVFMIGGGLLGAALLYRYGEKVSALLQNADYAAAYGAMGASVGLLTAAILGFLHLFLVFMLYHGKMKSLAFRDTQKQQDKKGHIIHMLVGTALPYSLHALVYHFLPLVDACFFFHFSKENTDAITKWGSYYGKHMVVIGIVGSLITLTALEPVRKIISLTEREEYRMAKEKIGYLMHQTALIVIPSAIFLAVLAENILGILFKGNLTQVAEWVMWGCIGLVFYVFAILFMSMLIRLKKVKFATVCGGIALLIHMILVLVLLQKTELGIMALVIGTIVFYLVLAIVGYVLVCRSFQYSQEWIRSFAYTIVAAGISGLIMMLLNKVISSGLGTTISLLICLPIGILVYMILLVVSRGVGEKEMENIAGGGIFRMIARMLHLI